MEKESTAIFIDDIRELNGSVIELSRSYAILKAFDLDTCKRYSKEIKDHSDFFDALSSSMFQGFCIITYQLFDVGKRGDVKSLQTLICYLASSDPDLERKLKSNIDAQKPILDKYISFRHKIFAHRDKFKPPWEMFGMQSKTRVVAEMEAIVSLAQDIINELANASGISQKNDFIKNVRLRQKHAGIDTNEILKALKKNNP